MTRYLLLIAVIVLLGESLVAGDSAGKPLMFADSYMLRAQGTEANYWNPALLSVDTKDIWLPAVNLGFSLANNSLDVKIYNHIMGTGYLNTADKDRLLNMIDKRVMILGASQISLFGFTSDNFALSSSVNAFAKASFDKDYLRLLLYGNTDENYEFTRQDTNLGALSYIDLTIGMGDVTLPLPPNIPTIKAGLSVSLLAGLEDIHTDTFYGSFTSNFDGLMVQQDMVFKSGIGGAGFKSLIGLVCDPLPQLSTGLTLDNLFGFISWGLHKEDLNYHFEVDSVYIANLSEDFYMWEASRTKGESYTTKLPPELRLAALYRFPKVSVSADYVQGFATSIVTSSVGRVALGAEVLPLATLPIRCGIAFGNSDYPWRVSYGIGFRFSTMELGIGMQTFKSLVPGNTSKGLAFAFNFKLGV